MKNHKLVNGKLLQTNKKFSDLKLSQKEFISNLIREEYLSFIDENGFAPKDESKADMLDRVYSQIKERDIWIPFNEIKKEFLSKIVKLSKERS